MKEGRDESQRSQERGVEERWGCEMGDDDPLQRQREIKMEMRRHQRALRSPTRRVWKPSGSGGRQERKRWRLMLRMSWKLVLLLLEMTYIKDTYMNNDTPLSRVQRGSYSIWKELNGKKNHCFSQQLIRRLLTEPITNLTFLISIQWILNIIICWY